MNNKTDIAVLSASYLAGEMNKREATSFLRSIENSEERKKEFLHMQEAWKKVGRNPLRNYSETGSAWDKLYGRLEEDHLVPEKAPFYRIFSPAMKIAASILLFLAISVPVYLFLLTDAGRASGSVNSRYVAVKGNAAYDLPDGSRVFLKKGSSLKVTGSFEQDRSVALKGEGYFDIMSDPSNPFIINTENAEVTVLGTSFNVKENNRDGITEVLVESGKVKIRSNRKKEELFLSPGQYGKVSRSSAEIAELHNANYLAWKTREFEFENENIRNVFSILEDAYQIDIIVEGEEITDLKLTSSYHKQSIDAIMETIATAFDLNIVKKKEKYIVNYKE